MRVGLVGPENSTQKSIAASASSQVLLDGNAVRVGATVYNDSTVTLYLNLGAAPASTTVYSVAILAGGYYEAPYGYRGAITGIWSSATGSARITELY